MVSIVFLLLLQTSCTFCLFWGLIPPAHINKDFDRSAQASTVTLTSWFLMRVLDLHRNPPNPAPPYGILRLWRNTSLPIIPHLLHLFFHSVRLIGASIHSFTA